MNIIEKVKQLNLPQGQYVVFGSGPLMIHGIRESHDIDLLVTPALYKKLEADSTWQVREWPDGSNYLAKAEMIEGVSFAPLREVLKWKQAYGRPKDMADVRLIAEYLSKQE